MFAHPQLLAAIADAKAIGPHVVLLRGAMPTMDILEASRRLRDEHGVEVLILQPDVEVQSLPVPSLAELVADVQRVQRGRCVQDGVAALQKKYLVIKREG